MKKHLLAFAATAFFATLASAQDTKVAIGISGWTGFAPLTLAKEAGIYKKHGLDVTIKKIPQKDRHLAIASGDVQCAATTVETWIGWNAAGIATTQIFQLDKSYGADGMVVKPGITKISDLKGKTVVSTSGTTNIKQINEANTERKLGLTILPAKDHAEAFLMVETGRAAAFVMDDVLLASLAASSKDPSAYEISTEALSKPEPYGIMLRKDDTEFKKVADDATAKLYTSPEGKALYDKWFTKTIPPRNINLNLPMSAEMKKQFTTPISSPDPAAY